MRPHDDANSWANELVYQLGYDLAQRIADELPELVAKLKPGAQPKDAELEAPPE